MVGKSTGCVVLFIAQFDFIIFGQNAARRLHPYYIYPDLNTKKLSGPRMKEIKPARREMAVIYFAFVVADAGEEAAVDSLEGMADADVLLFSWVTLAPKSLPIKTCQVGEYSLSISRLMRGAIRLSTGSCAQ